MGPLELDGIIYLENKMRFHVVKGIKWTSVFFVVMSLQLTACVEDSEQEMLQRAKEYMTQKKVDYAAIELRNILQADPENAEARYLLGKANMEIGGFASAKKEFQRALDAEGPSEKVVIAKIQAMLALGEYKEIIDDNTVTDSWPASGQATMLALKAAAAMAISDLQQAKNSIVAAENLDATAYEVLKTGVQLQLKNKQYVEAENSLSKALELYPGDTSLLIEKANLLTKQNNFEEAITLYQQIIDANQSKIMSADTRLAHINMLKLAILKKDYERAHKSRDALLANNAGDPEVNYIAAVSAYEEKEFDQANEYLQKILKIAATHPPTLLLSGTVNYAKKDYEQAAYFLSRYVANNPENANARKLLGRAYMALGQYDDAQAEFNAALSEIPDDAELIALVGLSEISGGQVQSGIAELEKALLLAPESDKLKLELAKAYIVDGQTDNAIVQLDEILQSDDNNQIRQIKVLAYLQSKNIDMAMSTARQMLVKSPDDPDVLSIMGSIQVAARDMSAARNYFNQALTIDPGHVSSEMNLARLDEQQGDLQSAEKRYRSILSTTPESIDVMKSLARLAAQQGDTENQIKWLETARQADKKELFSRVALAEIYLDQDKINNAEAIIRELDETYAKVPAVLIVKARLLMAQKRFTEADSVISAFIDAKSDADLGYYLRGQNQLASGNQMAALESLRKAYSLKSDELRNAILLARVEQNAGNYARVMELAEEIIKVVPDSAIGYVLKGDSLLATKKYQQALASFDMAWSRTKSRDIALRRFNVTRRLSGVEAAAPILISWLEGKPGDEAVLQELATAYFIEKQNKKAIFYYEKVLATQPENIIVLNNLAWLYGLENNPRALILAEKAYSLQPEVASVVDTYGWILLKNNKTAEALSMLKQAAEKLPDIPDVQYHYAKALSINGDTAAANRILKQLIESEKAFDGRKDAEKMLAK